MKIYRYSLNAAASLAGLAAVSGVAHADAVDYGALEELFNEPVTTSATGAPQRATEAPVNMVIITQDEIQGSGAIDIPGVLERYANVDVTRSAAGDADVSIRGYNGGYAPRLLVLVNGRQVYLDHYGMTNWNLIPVQMSEIRQIEVVSGPNTALFGFNAVAGVVNIITYDPLEDDVGSASVTVGEDDYRSGSFSVTHAISDNVALRLSGGVTEGDGWDGDETVATGFAAPLPNPGYDQSQINAHVGIRFSPKVRGNVELSAAHDDRLEELSTGLFASTNYETIGAKGDVSVETDHGLFEGQVYFNTLAADLETSNAGSLSVTPFKNRIFVSQGSWLNRLSPNHTVRVALEYRHNWLETALGAAQTTADVFSVAGMWNWTISPSLAATTAVRFDRLELDRDGAPSAVWPDYETDMDEPSINLGLVWRASDVDTFRFSAARGVQSPSMLEYGNQSTISVGNPNIQPTIVENLEIGWDRSVPMIDGRLRASVYWQNNDGFKYSLASGSIPNIYADNIGSSHMVGVDLSLEGQVDAFDWRLSYSHRDIDDTLDRAVPGPGTSACLPGMACEVVADFEESSPANVATAALSWTQGDFELGGDVRYVDETDRFSAGAFPLSTRTTIDEYTLVNARAAYNVTDWFTVALSGRNLFDDETETTSYSPIPRVFYLTLSSSF